MIRRNLTWISICLLLNGVLANGQIFCKDPKPPMNGIVLKAYREVGGNMTVTCNRGHILTGPATRMCRPDGVWEGEPATCEEIECPAITGDEHGNISSTDHNFLATITLQCNPGFIVEGYSKTVCQDNGQWSTPLGQCIKRPEDSTGDGGNGEYWLCLLLLFIPILVCVVVFYKQRRKRSQQEKLPNESGSQLLHLENHSAANVNEAIYYCRMTVEEASDVGNSDPFSSDYVTGKIRKAIEDRLQREKPVTADVLVNYPSQTRKDIFFDLTCQPALSKEDITDALTGSNLTIGTVPFHIVPGTLQFIDQITQRLVLKIIKKKDLKDKELDTSIDLETQYIRLKIMTDEQMAEVRRDTLEVPDKYQSHLEKHTGNVITDEEILKPGEVEKFILIRGRAGIGKTTLVQRSLLRWAHREWATHFKAIFLLKLRDLMTTDNELTLSDILRSCTAYGEIDVIPRTEWLELHQQQICIILDGIDELHNFIQQWETKNIPTDLSEEALPVLWGISLMKRACLPHTTLVVTSRPFTALSVLEEKATMMIELMGLTRERVTEFVDNNVSKERQKMVNQTLEKSPILMSVCSITFYCATLCQVLEEDTIATSLKTYTLITAYIIKMSIQRSAVNPIVGHLRDLCQLAYYGLLRGTNRALLQLVFDEDDLNKNNLQPDSEKISEAKQTGLFYVTEVTDPRSTARKKFLGQFIHLSIQEFLAMIGLLSQASDEIKKTLRSFPMSGQYNMSLLFLYGLAFNKENEEIRTLCAKLGVDIEVLDDIQNELIENAQKVPDGLQALQIIYESQSPEIAVKVGKAKFNEEVNFHGIKLTIVDILALTFLLRHHQIATSIVLQDVGLDPVCIKELAEFLKGNDSITNVTILDDGVNCEAVEYLAEALEDNNSISFLKLGSHSINDKAVGKLSNSLGKSSAVKKLVLDSASITDKGVQDLAFPLRHSPALESMTLSGFAMKDAGAKAILQAIKVKQTAFVTMWPPQCTPLLKEELKSTMRVTFKY